jgi:hypothetical protein
MVRITEKDIQRKLDVLNALLGSPLETWTRNENGHVGGLYTGKTPKYVANIGNVHTYGYTSGYMLHRIANEHGGVDTPFGTTPMRRRDLNIFLTGIIGALQLRRS